MTTAPTVSNPAEVALAGRRLTLRQLFNQQKPEMQKLLPRGMDAERLYRLALSECVKNPDLLKCSAESWALAMQTCAAQGLYPDSGLGYMYLIPRAGKVTAQRGYQGDIALARKSGEIADIYAEVVYEKDSYKVTKGLARNIEHVPYDGSDEPGALRACYAVAKLRSGDIAWVSLTKRDVDRHKLSSQTAGRSDGPWKQHEAAMWKKTAIHELFKWLPKSTEESERVAVAIAADADPRNAIETTALDLGRVEIPTEGEAGGSALDRVASELEGAKTDGAEESIEKVDPKECGHRPILEQLASTPVGTAISCPACDTDVEGTMTPDQVKAAVQAVAGAATPEPGAKKKPTQGRLGTE